MSIKGEPRITYNKPNQRDRDMYDFLAYIYPEVKKYQYAKMRFVDGETIFDIYEKEESGKNNKKISENSIRKYTEDVRKEIKCYDEKKQKFKYRVLQIKRGADKSKILKIFLDVYADPNFFLSEEVGWNDKIIRQVLNEKCNGTIYIKFGKSIFGIKGLEVSKSVCKEIIDNYIIEQKRKLPDSYISQKFFYIKFKSDFTDEKINDFIGYNLRFKKYNVTIQTVGKEYNDFQINLPVYLDSYGGVNKFKNQRYNLVTYPLTCIKLQDEDQEESKYYSNQWKELFKKIKQKLSKITNIGNCQIDELAEKMEFRIVKGNLEDSKYLYINIGENIILVLDDTVRNAKLIKEYKDYFEN